MNGKELRKQGFKVRSKVHLHFNGEIRRGTITILKKDQMKVKMETGEIADISFNES